MSDHMLVFSTSCADAVGVASERAPPQKWTASLRTPGPINQPEAECLPSQSREPPSVMLSLDEEWKADPSMQQFGNQDLGEVWTTVWDLRSWLHNSLENDSNDWNTRLVLSKVLGTFDFSGDESAGCVWNATSGRAFFATGGFANQAAAPSAGRRYHIRHIPPTQIWEEAGTWYLG